MRFVRHVTIALISVLMALAGGAFAMRRADPGPSTSAHSSARTDGPRVHVTERWRVALPVDVVGLPATDHAGVVVTAGSSQVVAVSPTGAVEWTTAVDGALANAPRLDRDLVVVAGERTVTALRRATGAVVWSVTTAPSGAANRANRPVVVGDTVVVTAADGLALGLSRTDGTERWRVALPTATTAEPAVGGGAGVEPVIVIVGIGRWWGIDPATGASLWSGDIGLFGTSSPVVFASGAGSVAAVATNERLVAVDGRTGEPKWDVPAEQSEFFQVPALASNGSELLVPDHWGRLTAFDPHDGRRLWEVDGSDTVAEFGEPVLVRDHVVALPLDAEGPRLGTPRGSVRLRPPADGHGVADLANRGLVVTTWGGATNYVVLYEVR